MLSSTQIINARANAVQAALLGHHNATNIHYTEGAQRWEGISRHRDAHNGEFPTEADCSSFVTWCLWNALYLPHNSADVVNGENWKGGYTGTMGEHGVLVPSIHETHHADVILYGTSAPWLHTAILVGHEQGNHMVISHGDEAGPSYEPFDYRSDVGQIRRYILP